MAAKEEALPQRTGLGRSFRSRKSSMRSDRTKDEIKNLKERIKELEDVCCENLDKYEQEQEAKNILIKELENARHDLSR